VYSGRYVAANLISRLRSSIDDDYVQEGLSYINETTSFVSILDVTADFPPMNELFMSAR